jgi:hypothetical protein
VAQADAGGGYPDPAPRLREDVAARRAKIGLACAAVGPVVSAAGMRRAFRRYLLDHVDEFDGGTSPFLATGWLAVAQAVSLAGLVGSGERRLRRRRRRRGGASPLTA